MTSIAEYEKTDIGTIQIAPEVIEVVAGFATLEVEGVAGTSGGIAGGIAELLGKKNVAKGVKVEVGQKEAAVDVNIVVQYGFKIPEVAQAVQESIKKSIEVMTGLNVVEVNVNVHDVLLKSDVKPEVDDNQVRVK